MANIMSVRVVLLAKRDRRVHAVELAAAPGSRVSVAGWQAQRRSVCRQNKHVIKEAQNQP